MGGSNATNGNNSPPGTIKVQWADSLRNDAGRTSVLQTAIHPAGERREYNFQLGPKATVGRAELSLSYRGDTPLAIKRLSLAAVYPDVPGGESRPSPTEDNVKPLQGNWLTVEEETNGKPFDKAEVKTRNRRITIKGHSFTMQRVTFGNFGVYDGKFDIDPATHAFDFVGKDPGGKLVEFKGIYAVEGDTLKLCYKYVNENGVSRPTTFRTMREPGVIAIMLVLKRDD